jgi:hypothetical protein
MSTVVNAPIPYPGKVVKKKHRDRETVLAVQRRLNEMNCGPIDEDGDFGPQTHGAVLLFQARFPDVFGLPLKVDGEIGSLTWAALFGAQSVPVRNETSNELLARVLDVAASQINVMETSPNRGPQVDEYVKSVGLNPGGRFAWCVCFLYWCFEKACKDIGRANPMIKTAGVLDHWNRAGTKGVPRVTTQQAINNPSLVRPGHIFTMKMSTTLGHTGIVERVMGGRLVTIEGNTNPGGSRDGVGVFRREMRKISSINKGFIDYSAR